MAPNTAEGPRGDVSYYLTTSGGTAELAMGTLNDPDNPVDWTRLKNVPADVAGLSPDTYQRRVAEVSA
jgi:hypothetical protein